MRREELTPAICAGALLFCLLFINYILRPLRETIGISGSDINLERLYYGTFITMLVLNPIFALLVAKYPRKRFIPYALRFFALNMLAFVALIPLLDGVGEMWLGRTFFVWLSVFNVFVVSLFWGFMADTYRNEQGKRLFGILSVGGTLGAIAGSAFAQHVASRITEARDETFTLAVCLVIGAVVIEFGAQMTRIVNKLGERFEDEEQPPEAPELAEHRGDKKIGGSAWTGFVQVARSPYLLGICAFMLLYALTSTIIYFEKLHVVKVVFESAADRQRTFAQIDFWTNIATFGMQLFITGRIMTFIGVGAALAALPLVVTLGFTGLFATLSLPEDSQTLILNMSPALFVLILFEASRRAMNYGVSRPAREVLYTVVSRDEKYKAKSLIDTVVYRGADVLGARLFNIMKINLELSPATIALVAVPIGVTWTALAITLGVAQRRRAARAE